MKRKKQEPIKVFYCRLSTKKTKGTTGELDFENQIQQLRERWGDLPVHQEIVSGAGTRRKLRDLVENLPEGSTIYTAHIDRLSRKSIYDLLSIIHEARERGLIIQTLHDGVITTDEEEFLLCAKAFSAQQERLAAQRRVRDQMEACRKQGRYWGVYRAIETGDWKFGTKPVKEAYTRHLPRMLELRQEGKSYLEIAKIFHQETGEKISGVHVGRLIKQALDPKPPKVPVLPPLTRVQ